MADALTRLQTTARSHGRVMVVETMGRDAGWIAREGGVAGGADAILLPERPFALDALTDFVRLRVAEQGYALVCVAEGARLADGAQSWPGNSPPRLRAAQSPRLRPCASAPPALAPARPFPAMWQTPARPAH